MNDVPCTYRISVKAIIKDASGRVLLLQEKDGSWELPGGGLVHGEDTKQALARELAEETGLVADWISDQPAAFWTIQKHVGSPILQWFAIVAYEAKVSGSFRPDPAGNEAQAAQYFTIDETHSLQLHDNTKPYFAPAT